MGEGEKTDDSKPHYSRTRNRRGSTRRCRGAWASGVGLGVAARGCSTGAVGLGRLESGSVPGRVGGLSSSRRARGALRLPGGSELGAGSRLGMWLGWLAHGSVGLGVACLGRGRRSRRARPSGSRAALQFLVLRGEEQGEGGKVGPACREERDFPLAVARSRREGEARLG
jgi:hypothetical protein